MSLSPEQSAEDNYGFVPFGKLNVAEQKTDDYGFVPFQAEKSQFEKEKSLINEDLDPEIERHTARLTSRALEQVAGLPGNVRDLAYSIKENYQNSPSIFNVKGPKKGSLETESSKKLGENISQLLGYLPTSSELKTKSEELSQGYTKPKNEFERIGDEVFERLVSSSLPGQGPRNVWRNIAAPVAGVLGKEAIKYIGGGDKAQAYTELGLNLAIPLMAGNAPQLNRDVWNEVRNTVPNVNINTQQMLLNARNLQQRIQRGLGSRSENQALRTLDNFIEKLERGHISADELMASNISLNEIVGDPELFGRGGHWFEEIRNMIRGGMEQVGQQAPEWYRNWQRANEIHGAIANSNFIANTVRKHAEPLVSEGARALFHAAVHTSAKGAALIPPVYLIYKGTQVLDRIARSPELMRYYTNVMTNSLRGNFATMADNLSKLDEALLEQEKKAKPPFKTSSQKK